MMLNDHVLSHGLFRWAGKWTWSRYLSIFCASHLIWVMFGLMLGVTMFGAEFQFVDLYLPLAVCGFLLPSLGLTMWFSVKVQRERPYLELGERPLIDPAIPTKSFPSAHTTSAFALVAVCAVLFPGLLSVMVPAAILVALGRVAAGVHFLSDVLMGALIGFGLTVLFIPLALLG